MCILLGGEGEGRKVFNVNQLNNMPNIQIKVLWWVQRWTLYTKWAKNVSQKCTWLHKLLEHISYTVINSNTIKLVHALVYMYIPVYLSAVYIYLSQHTSVVTPILSLNGYTKPIIIWYQINAKTGQSLSSNFKVY